MYTPKEFVTHSKPYIKGFFKWLLVGLLIGLVGGLAGAAFHISVEEFTSIREANPFLIWFLPIGGLAIAGLHSLSHVSLDTNIVIRAVQEKVSVTWLMAPLIFICSVISHLFGASVGREGAALQIGGSIGSTMGRALRMDDPDSHIAVMCGMSAAFSAVFGTPITAVFFAIEVAEVGIMRHAALLPCLASSLTAASVAHLFGIGSFDFHLAAIPALSFASAGQAAVLAVCCAALGIAFCIALHRGQALFRRLIANDYLRIFAGGLAVSVLLSIFGRGYSGAGTEAIYAAVAGVAKPEAFVLKMLFTVICVCVGYKGGEIVPTLFIGSTFGCVAGGLIGMDAGFAAALCLIGLFCAMVNCPIASIILSIELFGAEALPLFAIVCVISFMLSGSYSLYTQQSVVFSKITAQYINKHAR